MAKITVTVTMVPIEGQVVTSKIKISPTGVTLKEVLEKVGIDSEKKDFLLNGQPAELTDYVTANAVVDIKPSEAGVKPPAKEKEAEVQVQERPQGS